ncbi:hypothetical protein EV193_105177 [Herbihabitans rhizosphaerae]|uniref:Peptidoglycan lipid II flippase n=1 Tax=Herbihabitans rhizosphaerae TaxID=1872711 RepID=A0A4Q7KLU1_9PSEU|nr:protein kinase family protein [Herbihabitans rhizosphaerae]RZS37619.1 hypothetical protein EV193_105177 [Herbihabitans rhizosphaerae]
MPGAERPGSGPSLRATGGSLHPGGVVGDGRYRLLAQFGVDERSGAHLWRARDGQLRRDVALTVLVGEPGDQRAGQGARRTLERAAHAARFSHSAVARVLDVLSLGNGITASEGVLGIVVADWGQGTDLVDLVAEHPLPPTTAARLVEPLASAVEQAHHSGLVLGVDHPQRIRVSPDSSLRLAFPGPRPSATLRDDVRGLGAVLYLLLTGRWPLPGGPDGIPAAPTGPDGVVVRPRTLVPQIPDEMSEAAMRSLEDSSRAGIRTGAAFQRALAGIAEREEQTELISAIAADENDDRDDGLTWTTRRPVHDRARKRKLALGVTALAAATVGVLAWIGIQLVSFFGDGSPSGAATPPLPGTSTPGQNTDGQPPPPPANGGPVKIAGTKLFNVKEAPDNPSRVGRATDGDPRTGWQTDDYRQQFPSFKPGVGLLISLDGKTKLASVRIDSPSPGTEVEIRTATSSKPDSLGDTKKIAGGKLNEGSTEIAIPDGEPAQYVIVWITKLAGGGKLQSEITEVTFLRAR